MQERLQKLQQRLPVQGLQKLAEHPLFERIVAGLLGSLATLMLLGFVAFNWYSHNDLDVSLSGLEVMLGLGSDAEPFGRIVDLLLILIPLGAITQITVASLTFLKHLPFNYALISMTVNAALLFTLPLIWQDLSTNAFRGDFEGEIFDLVISGYSTAEQFWLGFLSLLISMGAAVLMFGTQLGLFSAELPELKPLPEPPAPSETTDGGSNS